MLFQVPVAGQRPGCLDGPTLPECFNGVVDLGAIDIERGRDHGMPLYNELRQAYGLAPKTSFTAITGESTDRFPADDPLITRATRSTTRTSSTSSRCVDIDGNPIALGDEDGRRRGRRRHPPDARSPPG